MQAFAEKNSFFAILHPSCASIALCTSRVLLREPYPPQPPKAARRLPLIYRRFLTEIGNYSWVCPLKKLVNELNTVISFG